jgi:hypothetical protein
VIQIGQCSTVTLFSYCRYIYQLTLEELFGLTSCDGISHIHHLKISKCGNLFSTSGLSNIVDSVTFEECRGLYTVHYLQNIPVVRFMKCEGLSKFAGLGNHRELHVTRNILFGDFFDEYKDYQLHKEVFGRIQHLYLQRDKFKPEEHYQLNVRKEKLQLL